MIYYVMEKGVDFPSFRKVYPGKSQARIIRSRRIRKKPPISKNVKRSFYGQLLHSSRIPKETDWRSPKATRDEWLSFIVDTSWNDPSNQGFHIPLSEY